MAGDPTGAVRQWWPSDMVSAFGEVTVNTTNDQFNIEVRKYRNGSHTDIGSGTQEGHLLKVALSACVPGGMNGRIGFQAYTDVWDGKGSPWAIAETFSTMDQYTDELLVYITTHPSKFLLWVAAQITDENITWQETYQRIADRTLGLDCNGFIGNWVRLCDRHVRLGPSMDLRHMTPYLKQTRYKRAEFKPGDVLLWGTAHIAAIDSRSVNGKFWICQSNGRGPNMTEYGFELVSYDGKVPQYRLGPYVAGDVGGLCSVYSFWAAGAEPLQDAVPILEFG